jgi:hypothetical protein
MDERHEALTGLAYDFLAREVAPHETRFAKQQQMDRETWKKAGAVGLLAQASRSSTAAAVATSGTRP